MAATGLRSTHATTSYTCARAMLLPPPPPHAPARAATVARPTKFRGVSSNRVTTGVRPLSSSDGAAAWRRACSPPSWCRFPRSPSTTPRGLFVLEEDDDIDLLERVKEDMKKGMEKRGH